MVVILLVVTMLVTACTTKEPATDISPSLTSNTDESSLLQVDTHQEYSAMSDYEWVYIDDISALLLINDETNVPISLPIYIDKYPYGQGGALFTIDQSLINGLKENLLDFLRILYGESEAQEFDIKEYDDDIPSPLVFYDTGTTEINSKLAGLSTITNDYGIENDMRNDSLLENKLIQAALEYLNITVPRVSSITEYTEDGEIYEHIAMITETSDDFLENTINNSCLYVKASYSPDSSGVFLEICKADISELYSNETTFPYQEVRTYVQTLYSFEESSRIYAEMYYSSTVEPDLFYSLLQILC